MLSATVTVSAAAARARTSALRRFMLVNYPARPRLVLDAVGTHRYICCSAERGTTVFAADVRVPRNALCGQMIAFLATPA